MRYFHYLVYINTSARLKSYLLMFGSFLDSYSARSSLLPSCAAGAFRHTFLASQHLTDRYTVTDAIRVVNGIVCALWYGLIQLMSRMRTLSGPAGQRMLFRCIPLAKRI